MAKAKAKALYQMDAEEAIASFNSTRADNSKGLGKAIVHKPRMRKASGSHVMIVDLSKLPKGSTVEHHLGLATSKVNGKPAKYACVCLTHNRSVLCTTRHQATFGAVFTALKDARTPKQLIQSKGFTLTDGIGWCDGCVKASLASV